MKEKQNSSESGQALILVVLGFVVLLGFTALAIDGGMVFADRRAAQNAGDSSALAGAAAAAMDMENRNITYKSWNCDGAALLAVENTATNAAIAQAPINHYSIDADISDQNGVQTNCTIFDNGSFLDKFLEVHTMITTDTQTTFAEFIYGGPLRNVIDSRTRVRPRSPLAFGNAIVALREDCPNTDTGGVHYDGTQDLSVTGGGIFSNACMRGNGNVKVDVYGGYDITCIGTDCLTVSGHPSITAHDGGQIAEGTVHLPDDAYYIPPPDCSSLPDRGYQHGGGTISPGRYSGLSLTVAHDLLEMQPGLYCFSGTFKANGGTILGNGVTIYITSGDFDVSGGVQIQLNAPPARNCTYCPFAIPGVLIYLDKNDAGEVALEGTSDSQYLGVVYAPSGQIDAGGTGSEISEIHAQLIGDTVKLHGTTNVVIHFEGEELYSIPARIELSK